MHKIVSNNFNVPYSMNYIHICIVDKYLRVFFRVHIKSPIIVTSALFMSLLWWRFYVLSAKSNLIGRSFLYARF